MTKRTALTGFIVPKCKVYGNGFFSEESLDPDNFNDELNSLRKRFKDKTIDARKAEIQKIKDSKQQPIDDKYFIANLEKRDGRIVIHRRYNVLKHKDTNQYIISARKDPYIGYRRTYRNENGMTMTEDGRYLIKRRHELKKRDGRFVIGSSKLSGHRCHIKEV